MSRGRVYVERVYIRRYGLGHFIFDLFMTGITGGLWLAWLLLKFLFNGRR